MSKIFHLIRHGESQANQQGVYQGQNYDTPLTKKGHQQAQAVAKILKNVSAHSIYSSPLKRSYQTALFIKKQTKLKLIKDNNLLEINHGNWEGKKSKDLNSFQQKKLKLWRQNPVGIQMTNGENIQDVVTRCKKFIKSLDDRRYVVVAHDLVIRVIASMALHHDYKYIWKYYLDNCGVTTVSFNPLRLVSLNQNFHLKSVRSILNRQAL